MDVEIFFRDGLLKLNDFGGSEKWIYEYFIPKLNQRALETWRVLVKLSFV